MLESLHIRNYALIEQLDIKLSDGFIVLTGETGAGKSIILGALGLLLGERAQLSSIKDITSKCIIEGEFNLANYQLEAIFSEEDIDYEEHTIIRREISTSGKSRAFINDTPVNLITLRRISSLLVDIHSQHQNLEVEDESFQFQLVDSIAKNHAKREAYYSAFCKLKQLQKEKDKLIDSQQKQSTDIDYWEFQLKELQAAKFKEEEQIALEEEYALFDQLETIQNSLAQADIFFNSEQSPIAQLQQLAADFNKISSTHAISKDFSRRIQSTYIELKDIAEAIITEKEGLNNDPERAQYVRERLDLIYHLQQKHAKTSISSLLALQKELEDKISKVQNFAEDLANLEEELSQHQRKTESKALELSKSRAKVIPQIQEQIQKQLHTLGMPHAKVILNLIPTNYFREQGKEKLSIEFSANKNSPLASIREVASGGELSRLMLCIKQLMAKSQVLPTLIFDEIDTGVSGEIADKMGQMMTVMAQQMQVIAITHLPQIAARAGQHWEVFKEDTTEKTLTSITELKKEERVYALAKMLSGSQLTDEAIANAKALLANQ